MARQFVILALIFFAVVGMSSLMVNASTPAASDAAAPLGPAIIDEDVAHDDDVIGTIDGEPDEAASIGAPVAANTFPDLPKGQTQKGAATANIKVSTISYGVVTAAAVGSFFF